MKSDIERVRELHRKLSQRASERGVSRQDLSIAALYAALDIGQTSEGDAFAAIEWMRTGLDVLERAMLERRAEARRNAN